jgi:hypothetical protein
VHTFAACLQQLKAVAALVFARFDWFGYGLTAIFGQRLTAAVMALAGTWQVHGAGKWAAGRPAPAADHSHGEQQSPC